MNRRQFLQALGAGAAAAAVPALAAPVAGRAAGMVPELGMGYEVFIGTTFYCFEAGISEDYARQFYENVRLLASQKSRLRPFIK